MLSQSVSLACNVIYRNNNAQHPQPAPHITVPSTTHRCTLARSPHINRRRPRVSPPSAMGPQAPFTAAGLDSAFRWVCQQRKQMPPNADIWHLRHHWPTIRSSLHASLNSGTYQLRPMRLYPCADGETRALWDAQDALGLRALTELLRPHLPVHRASEHIAGHQGGQSSVRRVSAVLRANHYRYVCRATSRAITPTSTITLSTGNCAVGSPTPPCAACSGSFCTTALNKAASFIPRARALPAAAH